ncbi:leucine--tRNA ligase [Buchnera aphidicola]|uniref:leucine--tRNA ligase n=1 Tax=Buchnera aphidicola TaxID=9 RepID=UPI00339D34B8
MKTKKMKKNYNPHKIEKKIQTKWIKKKKFQVFENNKKKKYYCVPMLPYPSGNLHMGHVRNYTISDVISRYHSMLGKNVLQPIGWDSFGLPAEEAAIKNKKNPKEWTRKNIKYMKKQLKSLGFSYDWNREISTCDPNYYKWEQWFFIKLYKKKLVYKKTSLVKWCTYDKTVLANEQVIKGKCWRCDTKVILKKIPQWFLKIRNYAEELYQGIKTLKGWPEKVKNMQKNWIGRSKGIEINLKIKNSKKNIKVYTKKIHSILDAEYIAVSVNNKILKKLIKNDKNIRNFIKKQQKNLISTENFKNIQNIGMNTNIFAIHPFNQKKLPIWIANFVSIKYGNNIIIASPKHSISELNFCKKNNILNFKEKYKKNFIKKNINKTKSLVQKILQKIKKKKIGIETKKYKIQDWNISRQRYWGTPIPIAVNKKGQEAVISKNKLPVIFPELLDFQNKKKMKKWRKITINGKKFIREKDTFDTFFESSWYYARYTCPKFKDSMIDPISSKYWLPIDQYIGGIEHATMHLIYFRFFHKLLRDFKLVKTNEPAKNLLCQGMVLSHAYYFKKNKKRIWINKKDVQLKKNKKGKIIAQSSLTNQKIISAGMIKMSKSKNNGIDPNEMIKKYGADSVRLFIMFSAPVESDLYWNEQGLRGMYRFLNKLWNFCYSYISQYKKNNKKNSLTKYNAKNEILLKLNKTIYQVSQDIEIKKSFNTAIAKIMKFFKYFKKNVCKIDKNNFLIIKTLITIIKLLSPFTPHYSYKILSKLKKIKYFKINKWPKMNKKLILNKTCKIIIQINGKFCCVLITKKNLSKKEIFSQIIKKKEITKKIHNKKIIKKFFIPKKILNLITEV